MRRWRKSAARPRLKNLPAPRKEQTAIVAAPTTMTSKISSFRAFAESSQVGDSRPSSCGFQPQFLFGFSASASLQIFGVPGKFINRSVSVRQGAFLPHWTAKEAIYHTVFRLADSLPSEVIERYRLECEAAIADLDQAHSPSVQDRLRTQLGERIDRYLDPSQGQSWLKVPSVAQTVADAITHFDGTRYALYAWCVMPNHVHVVLRPFEGHGISPILHSWKSFTATAANRILGRTGAFWHKESYDHIVRDAAELERTITYVRNNPVEAALTSWPWVWPGNG